MSCLHDPIDPKVGVPRLLDIRIEDVFKYEPQGAVNKMDALMGWFRKMREEAMAQARLE